MKKIFVLDTNVILHDAECIFSFQENDLVIPITVLEELDQFKKGHGDINFQAREFLRTLDGLTGDLLSRDGAVLGPGLGRIRVVLGEELDQRLSTAFVRDSPDHRIVNTALMLSQSQAEEPVVLVSKDTNVRMKAKAFGLRAQDYIRDKVESVEKLYTGQRSVETTDEIVDAFYHDREVAADVLRDVTHPLANENFIFRSGSKSVLACYVAGSHLFRRVEKTSCYGIMPRNAEQTFALHALTRNDIKLVTLVGKAGTGKTLLALAGAVVPPGLPSNPAGPPGGGTEQSRDGLPAGRRGRQTRPVHAAAVRQPDRHPAPVSGNGCRRAADPEDARNREAGHRALAYIRGRSLQKIFFIVDEAQNLTPHEVKTIITRAGEGTKIVFTGDIHQIDHPFLDSLSNGLSYMINRMVGQTLYSHITLEKGERSLLADLASQLL